MEFLKIKGPAAWSLVRTQPGPLTIHKELQSFANLKETKLPIIRKFCFLITRNIRNLNKISLKLYLPPRFAISC